MRVAFIYSDYYMKLKTFCLQVFLLLVNTENKQRIEALSVTYYEISGRLATLLCPINYKNESVDVGWEKNTEIIYASQEFVPKYSDRYKILDVNGSFHKKLQIENVTKEDAGNFTCFTSWCLEKYSMQLIIVDVPVAHFNNNFLSCIATDWPQMSTLFFCEQMSVFGEHIRFINASDSALQMFEISETESVYKINGKYACIVKFNITGFDEEVRTAAIDIKTEGKPTCIWTYEVKEIMFGMMESSVSIEVFVYSVPFFDRIVWLQGQNIINTDIDKYRFYNISKVAKTNIYGSQIRLLVYSVILQIKSLTKEDFTNYTASVVNTQGECNCTVELRPATDTTRDEGSSNSVIIPYLLSGSACVVTVITLHILYRLYKRLQIDRINRKIQPRHMLPMQEINAGQSTEISRPDIGKVQLANDYSTVYDLVERTYDEVNESIVNKEATLRRFIIKS